MPEPEDPAVAVPRSPVPKLPPAASADASGRFPGEVESFPVVGDGLTTKLSWMPLVHDRLLQLRCLAVAVALAVAYLCFHLSLAVNGKLALASEEQRVGQLFQQCLDHDGTPGRVVFTGDVPLDAPALPDSAPRAAATVSQRGDSYTFPVWMELSKFTDPTVFVGRLRSSPGVERLVVISIDLQPAQGRAEVGNVGVRASSYAATLPLTRSGQAQLNIFLKQGTSFRAFEGSRESDGQAASFTVEAGGRPSRLHVRLQPDGTLAIDDDAKEISHDTQFYELDRALAD